MRKIIQLSGDLGQIALANDGTIWLWTPYGWKNANRGELPQDQPTPEVSIGDEITAANYVFQESDAIKHNDVIEYIINSTSPEPIAPPVKRKPGRPRKVQP